MHWRSCYVTCFIRHYEANQYVLFSYVLHSGQQHFVLIKLNEIIFFLKINIEIYFRENKSRGFFTKTLTKVKG